jgi:hypothetical protein
VQAEDVLVAISSSEKQNDPRDKPAASTDNPNSVSLLLLAPGRGEVALLAVFNGKDLESLALRLITSLDIRRNALASQVIP